MRRGSSLRVALQRGDQADEHQAHGDGDHAADPLSMFAVDREGLR